MLLAIEEAAHVGVEREKRRKARQEFAMMEGAVPTFQAEGQRTFSKSTDWTGYWIDARGVRHDCGHDKHETAEAAKACAMRGWQTTTKP